MTVHLTQYHRVLGGSSPTLWVRIDSDNLKLEAVLAHLNKHDSLDAVLVTDCVHDSAAKAAQRLCRSGTLVADCVHDSGTLVTTVICGSESTYINVCRRVYENKVWWMPWYKGEPRLECLEVNELLPYLPKYDVKVGVEIRYWGGDDL